LQTFSIKFASAELAGEFKTAFEAGQKEMNALLAGTDAATGSAEADAAADAISKVSVGADSEATKSPASPAKEAAKEESAEK
jgi:hypothetical protein